MASISSTLVMCVVWCLVIVAQTQVQQINVNEINLPTANLTNATNQTANKTTVTQTATAKTTTKPTTPGKSRQVSAGEMLVCPANNTSIPLFTLPCERDADCALLGPGLLCCERKDVRFKRCLKGVPFPRPEPTHSPWLRVFPRKCPDSPLAEFGEITVCATDNDCGSRICCPEPGTSESYCRTAALRLDDFPTVRRMLEPVTSLMSYFQCSPAPPAILDLFQQPCNSLIDCIPNLCCQERGRRVCRPPRQSFLTVFAGLTRRVATASTAARGGTNTATNRN